MIELMFALALDMSLPEFQPQEDISGNVIVSEVDDVSGEFIAQEIPLNEIPIEKTSDLPLLGLSQEEDWTEELPPLRSSGDRSINYLPSSTLEQSNIYNDNGSYSIRRNSSRSVYYILLEGGTTYNVACSGDCFLGNTLSNNNITVTLFTQGEYTPSFNQYIYCSQFDTLYVYVVEISGGDEPGGDVSGDSPGGNISADLTNVESKLDNVIVLQRSILMTLLVTFLFPIIKSCVNLLKGGKDV